MEQIQEKMGKFFIISPTESILTKQGNRHPSLAQYLVERDNEVIYYSSDFYHAEKRRFSSEEIKAVSEEIDYELKIFWSIGYQRNISIKRVLNNLILSIKFLWSLLKNVTENDTIIIPSRPVELIYAISLLKKIKKCNIVLDVEDIWPDALIIENKFKKKVFEIYCNLYLSRSIKNYDKFLTISPSYNEWIWRYGGNDKIAFLPLGFEKERWNKISNCGLLSEQGSINFVLIAVLQLQVDILPFIKAIANKSGYSLSIIGENGKGERYPEVKNYLEKNNVNNVKFIGRVPKGEVQNYLNEMTIGVSPIISELLPNKFFDYLASNLPVLNMGNRDMGKMVTQLNVGWSIENETKEIQNWLMSITREDIRNFQANIFEAKNRFERKNINNKIFNFISNSEILENKSKLLKCSN